MDILCIQHQSFHLRTTIRLARYGTQLQSPEIHLSSANLAFIWKPLISRYKANWWRANKGIRKNGEYKRICFKEKALFTSLAVDNPTYETTLFTPGDSSEFLFNTSMVTRLRMSEIYFCDRIRAPKSISRYVGAKDAGEKRTLSWMSLVRLKAHCNICFSFFFYFLQENTRHPAMTMMTTMTMRGISQYK